MFTDLVGGIKRHSLEWIIVLFFSFLAVIALDSISFLRIEGLRKWAILIMFFFFFSGFVAIYLKKEVMLLFFWSITLFMSVQLKDKKTSFYYANPLKGNDQFTYGFFKLEKKEDIKEFKRYVAKMNPDFITISLDSILIPNIKDYCNSLYKQADAYANRSNSTILFYSKYSKLRTDTFLFEKGKNIKNAYLLKSSSDPIALPIVHYIANDSKVKEYPMEKDIQQIIAEWGSMDKVKPILLSGEIHLEGWSKELKEMKEGCRLVDSRNDIDLGKLDQHIFHSNSILCLKFFNFGIGIHGIYKLKPKPDPRI
jgi:hypothetical protein